MSVACDCGGEGAPAPKLKICGVNDVAFAQAAERLGADYLGLIFAEGSPRQVTPARAREILAALTGRIRPVGVFTTTPVEEIAALAQDLGIRIIQLHRRATAADIAYLKARGFTVWALAGSEVAEALLPSQPDALLYDSSHGDGETALPPRRAGVSPAHPVPSILAGGISCATLPAVLASGADIVDVSGSLESARGVKSIAKLEAFMDAFRRLLRERGS